MLMACLRGVSIFTGGARSAVHDIIVNLHKGYFCLCALTPFSYHSVCVYFIIYSSLDFYHLQVHRLSSGCHSPQAQSNAASTHAV